MSVDIDHIFPKAWCEKHDVDANLRDSIVNKTPISYQTNRSIGGRAPASYLATLERQTGLSQEDLDSVVADHHIDPSALRANDYSAFFAARATETIALIEEAMGKDVARDLTNADTTSGMEAEGPESFEDQEPPEADIVGTDAEELSTEADV